MSAVRGKHAPVAGVLLAAGEGSRLGGPKAVVTVAGERLADRGVRTLRDGGCEPVCVVSGAVGVTVAGAWIVDNPLWESGLGTSLRAGLDALPEDVGAAVVALADQPLVTAVAVRRLCDAHRAGASVAVATYEGLPRNPVLLSREHWPEVRSLATGDVGARPFLRANPHLVTPVPCDDAGSPEDVDTRDDLERIRETLDAGSD
ncbi:nicotine blue oxidoreductase [Haloactinospora alba]|uniref:Nicotine blue oxidoreductase n=1 Tax=Haloactinospora alba TaxID=405555 RepID=A0A543NJM8_9ACTN|nr:nucleotidyltransferase family protein [Haloactinospora alba]TQN32006.1 nicotine blue oxidoreductase [Haloactinospora alba]